MPIFQRKDSLYISTLQSRESSDRLSKKYLKHSRAATGPKYVLLNYHYVLTLFSLCAVFVVYNIISLKNLNFSVQNSQFSQFNLTTSNSYFLSFLKL